jgi:hypothetical protein
LEEYVLNPRRSPRIPARCGVSLTYRNGIWEAETEDLGPSGCQIISPRPIAEGGRIQLAISSARVPEPLEVGGRVAWITGTAPHRLGVAFVAGSADDPVAWFERYLESDPKLAAAIRRVPDRLPLSAWLFLAAPPSMIIDFTGEELSLIRALGNGATISEVRTRLGREWEPTKRTIFALLTRRLVCLTAAGAVPFQRWKRVLDSAEAALAADRLGRPGAELKFDAVPPAPRPAAAPAAPPAPRPVPAPAPARPAPPAAQKPIAPPPRAPPRSPTPFAAPHTATIPGAEALQERDLLPGSIEEEEPISLASMEEETAPPAREPPAAPMAPPPPPPRTGGRPARAQELFDRARAEHAAGNTHKAIELLRSALAASPRDPEIGALLGQLAFKDRRM